MKQKEKKKAGSCIPAIKFFFSSRRRHTRCGRDWSSDVCSPIYESAGLMVGIYEEGSVFNILYQGVMQGWYPPLIFLGIGAMTDFSSLIANPKLILIGAAAQDRKSVV